MRGLRGVFAGVLTLIALETIVSTTNAATRTAGLLGATANGIAHLLDPNMAAIPIVGVPKSMRWIGHTAAGATTSGATYSTDPSTGKAPIVAAPPGPQTMREHELGTGAPVAPPPANNKPKPPKATVYNI